MTIEEKKRLALVAAMLVLGGGGTKKQVLDKVEELDLLLLNERDRERMISRNEIRWRNDLAFTRKHLVQNGYVSDTAVDDWRVTEKGRAYGRDLALQVAKASGGTSARLELAARFILRQEAPEVSDESALALETSALEGQRNLRWSTTYERDASLRKAAIEIHGLSCMGCGFTFDKAYGEAGRGFIEVHHTKPISQMGGAMQVDARTELVVLCANCHRIVHRRKTEPLSLDELRRIVAEAKIATEYRNA